MGANVISPIQSQSVGVPTVKCCPETRATGTMATGATTITSQQGPQAA